MKTLKRGFAGMQRGGRIAGVAMLLALASCGGEAQAPVAEAVAGTVPGMSVTNARLVLAPVAGNPAAVYFDLAYDGDQALSIRKAEVEGAGMSMMHHYGKHEGKVQMMEALPVALTKGAKVPFEPGALHVMAMEPPASLKPGDKAKITLTMSGGATHSFEAEVRAAGEER